MMAKHDLYHRCHHHHHVHPHMHSLNVHHMDLESTASMSQGVSLYFFFSQVMFSLSLYTNELLKIYFRSHMLSLAFKYVYFNVVLDVTCGSQIAMHPMSQIAKTFALLPQMLLGETLRRKKDKPTYNTLGY